MVNALYGRLGFDSRDTPPLVFSGVNLNYSEQKTSSEDRHAADEELIMHLLISHTNKQLAPKTKKSV